MQGEAPKNQLLDFDNTSQRALWLSDKNFAAHDPLRAGLDRRRPFCSQLQRGQRTLGRVTGEVISSASTEWQANRCLLGSIFTAATRLCECCNSDRAASKLAYRCVCSLPATWLGERSRTSFVLVAIFDPDLASRCGSSNKTRENKSMANYFHA